MRLSSKNKFISVLIFITITVWGMIIYRIIDHFSNDNDKEITSVINSSVTEHRSTIPADTLISYKVLERDPFRFGSIKSDQIVETQFVHPQQTLPPLIQYNLDGVIITGNKKLIIINDLTNQKSIFMREGEQYDGIKIIKIEYNKVTLTENGAIKEVDFKN